MLIERRLSLACGWPCVKRNEECIRLRQASADREMQKGDIQPLVVFDSTTGDWR